MSALAGGARSLAPRVRPRPRALVLRAPGTNCDRETALALDLAGAAVESVHLERLLTGERDLDNFALLILPGGFSFGDHLGAGAIWAHRLEALSERLMRFVDDGRPVLGICNGFQALLRLGLLQGGALAPNASGRFECRWVWMRRPHAAHGPLLDGIERIAMPIGHGEGRFVARDVANTPHPQPFSPRMGRREKTPSPDEPGEGVGGEGALPHDRELGASTLEALNAQGQVALVYCDAAGNPGEYPVNPNGSEGAVAALTNVAGNVLGLMPHPERNVSTGQAPAGRPDGAGLTIFTNAVRMVRN